jgi:hypothetical protein
MTYDFHGSWDQNRAHHSSLNSKDSEKDDTMYIVGFINIFLFRELPIFLHRILLLNIFKNWVCQRVK